MNDIIYCRHCRTVSEVLYRYKNFLRRPRAFASCGHHIPQRKQLTIETQTE